MQSCQRPGEPMQQPGPPLSSHSLLMVMVQVLFFRAGCIAESPAPAILTSPKLAALPSAPALICVHGCCFLARTLPTSSCLLSGPPHSSVVVPVTEALSSHFPSMALPYSQEELRLLEFRHDHTSSQATHPSSLLFRGFKTRSCL